MTPTGLANTGNDPKARYIRTASGIKFHPYNPQPEEICIEDIAAGLSKACRYAGHTPRFYSVAEHCIECAAIARPENKLAALLHDASEAYIADIAKPIKTHLEDYRALESCVTAAIDQRFGIDSHHPDVKDCDYQMLVYEFAAFFPQYIEEDLGVSIENIGWKWKWLGMEPREAEDVFLQTFKSLGGY